MSDHEKTSPTPGHPAPGSGGEKTSGGQYQNPDPVAPGTLPNPSGATTTQREADQADRMAQPVEPPVQEPNRTRDSARPAVLVGALVAGVIALGAMFSGGGASVAKAQTAPTCDPFYGRHCGPAATATATVTATSTRPVSTATATPPPPAPTCDPFYGRHCQ